MSSTSTAPAEHTVRYGIAAIVVGNPALLTQVGALSHVAGQGAAQPGRHRNP